MKIGLVGGQVGENERAANGCVPGVGVGWVCGWQVGARRGELGRTCPELLKQLGALAKNNGL